MKRPTLLIVFLIVFVDLLGFGLIIPIFPFYAKTFGAGPAAFGLLLASYSLMQFLFNPFWGRLSDRIGRRPVMLISVAGSAVGFFIFARAHTFLVLLLARLLAGIMNSNIAAAQSAVADVTPEEGRAKGMGMVGAAFGLGFVFGPAIGGLMSRFGFPAPAYLAAALSALNFVLALTLLPETNPQRLRTHAQGLTFTRWWQTLTRREVGVLISIFFISTFAQSVITTTLPYILLDNFHFNPATAAEKTGWLFTFIGIIIALTQGGAIRPLLKVVRERWLIVAGTLIMAGALVLLPNALTIAVLLVALCLLAVGNGISTPSLQSLISRRTSAAEQGLVLGTSQSMSSLARIVGPAWGGFAYDRWGHQAPYLTSGAVMALAFVISLSALRPSAPD